MQNMINDCETDKMGRIFVEIELSNDQDVQLSRAGMLASEKIRKVKIQGLVDSGATFLVLPGSVSLQLGLVETGDATVKYADQRSSTRKIVEQVRLEYAGRHGSFQAIVEPARKTALIGAIVMEALDLIVDCGKQQLVPRDPDHVVAEIE